MSITILEKILKANGEGVDQINEKVGLEIQISSGETDDITFESSEATKEFIEELERKSYG